MIRDANFGGTMLISKNHLSLAGLFLYSTLSFAETGSARFLYQLYDFPKVNSNCHLEAKSLAERFTAITGVAATGECKAIKEQSYDIFIYYTAGQELPRVSTYPEMLLQDRIHIFPTETSCKERLVSEVDYFKSVTGLEPWTSFCAINETYYGVKTWALRIDAFGNPAIKPFWAEAFMLGSVDGMTETTAEEMIGANFRKTGTDVRLVHFRNDAKGMRQFSMLYYNSKPLNIEIQVIASTLDSRSQCQAELSLVSAQVPDSLPHTVFCADNQYVRSFEVVGIVDLGSWFKPKLSVETFANYDACTAGRDSLLEMYRGTVGLDVAAGLCTKTDGTWRLNLLERRR
jgi:hypothetical protein